jgi:TIR domain
MPSGPGERYDFFLSRRGSVATIAQEVADVLTEKGYRVLVQNYDIPLGASFVEAMHEAIINSRDPDHPFYRRPLTLTLHPQRVHKFRGGTGKDR